MKTISEIESYLSNLADTEFEEDQDFMEEIGWSFKQGGRIELNAAYVLTIEGLVNGIISKWVTRDSTIPYQASELLEEVRVEVLELADEYEDSDRPKGRFRKLKEIGDLMISFSQVLRIGAIPILLQTAQDFLLN